MSKKSRLKKQKEKQIQMKKLADLEELEEKEAAKHKESKGAKKMRRKAKHGYVNGLLLALKMIMTAAFLWSGFFFGGVLTVGVLNGYVYIDTDTLAPHWVAYFTLAGSVIIFAGIVLSFLKKYLISFALTLTGNVLFMRAVGYIIRILKENLEKRAIDPSLNGMDRTYMIRYYPILITLVMSAVMLIIWIVQTAKRRRREKSERDNAPVASIVDD